MPAEGTRAAAFFFESNLSALRELALRCAAQTLDRRLLDPVASIGKSGNWAGGERIVVAISDQHGGDAGVRAAKRLADAIWASWTVVVIETPRTPALSAEARTRMADALALATELGATITTVPASTVFERLMAHIRKARATAVVIGKSQHPWWFEFRHGLVLDRLVRSVDDVAMHVISIVAPKQVPRGRQMTPPILAPATLIGLTFLAANTALAALLMQFVASNALNLLYLLPVIANAAIYGCGRLSLQVPRLRWPITSFACRLSIH